MNILLLAPEFHGYGTDFVTHLRNLGADNIFVYKDGLYGKDLSVVDRFIKKIKPSHGYRKYGDYIDKVIDDFRGGTKIDYVILVCGGNCFSPETADKLRSAFKEAKFICYVWDSFANRPNIESFYKKFDVYYSFAKADAEKYGMRFLPLFYPNEPLGLETEYDYCLITSYNQSKGKPYFQIKNILPYGLKGLEYLYLSKKTYYYLKKLCYPKAFKGLKKGNFEYKHLSREEAWAMMAKSKVVLNCALKKQTGLGFATFEALRLGRKVVTPIEAVKQFDFYTPDNIFVIEENTESIPKSFFETPFNEKFAISEKYSPKSFFTQLLSD